MDDEQKMRAFEMALKELDQKYGYVSRTHAEYIWQAAQAESAKEIERLKSDLVQTNLANDYAHAEIERLQRVVDIQPQVKQAIWQVLDDMDCFEDDGERLKPRDDPRFRTDTCCVLAREQLEDAYQVLCAAEKECAK